MDEKQAEFYANMFKTQEPAPAEAVSAFEADTSQVAVICRFSGTKKINSLMHNIGNVIFVTMETSIRGAFQACGINNGKFYRLSTATYAILLDSGYSQKFISAYNSQIQDYMKQS